MDFGSSCLVGQKVCDLSSVSLSGLSLDVGGGSRSSGGMGGIASNVGRWGEQREVLTALNVGEGKGRDGEWGLLLQIG